MKGAVAMKDELFPDRRQPLREAVFPRAVASAMVYAGVLALAILYLRTWLVTVSRVSDLPALHVSSWAGGGGAARLCWAFAGVGILVMLYLWSSCRTAHSGRFRRIYLLLHFGAAVVVLLLQWALVATLRGIPEFSLVPFHP